MSELEDALDRFDRALEDLEKAMRDTLKGYEEALTARASDSRNLASARKEQNRLESELGAMRVETAMLEAMTDRLTGKLDVAIGEIRDILEPEQTA